MQGRWQTISLQGLQAGLAPLQTDHVELWFADLGAFRHALSTHADSVLSPEERARSRGMLADSTRANFVTSCILMRSVLSARLGIAPRDLSIIRGDHGKPALNTPQDAPCLQFNLSHGGDAWLCGISTSHAIGVDVETRRAVPNADRLATRVLSAKEQAELAAMSASSDPDRDQTFLRGWTRKEAVLKAAGSGFSWSARDIEVGLDVSFRRAALPQQSGWEAGVWSIELPVAGFGAVAVMAEGTIAAPSTTLRQLIP